METLLSYSQAHQQLLNSFQTPTKTTNTTLNTNSTTSSTSSNSSLSSASSASSSSPSSSSMISPTNKSAFHQPLTSSSTSLTHSFDALSHLGNPLYHHYHPNTIGNNNNSNCTNSTVLSPAAVAAAAAVAAEFHHNPFNYHSSQLVHNDFFKMFTSTPATLSTNGLSLQASNATALSPLSVSNLTNQKLSIASQPSSSSSIINSIGLHPNGYSPNDDTDSNGFYNSFVGRLASQYSSI